MTSKEENSFDISTTGTWSHLRDAVRRTGQIHFRAFLCGASQTFPLKNHLSIRLTPVMCG